ncbi:phytoene desaturase family protein [Jatrophihabitans fulvus]
MDVDAVVVGAGHNGLVAANLLRDAGWDVVVLEAADVVGGAVRSDRTLHPDYVTDRFSAFYPLGYASPVLQGLELGPHGLHWTHAPAVLAHVLPDDRCAVLSRDLDTTARSLDGFAPGDGDTWRVLTEQFESIREPLLTALFTPFPPLRSAASIARRLGVADGLRFLRFGVQPVRRAGDELFEGVGGTLLLAGNALHTDLAPENAGSALYGWLLAMLGQTVGFPVPVGGAGELALALERRLTANGGVVRTSTRVDRVLVEGGRAVGVRTAGGETIRARAVLADVDAPTLYRRLVGEAHLPRRLVDDLDRFQWDSQTMKLDWALSAPVPWTADDARGAGTVHLGVDLDGLTRYAADLATGTVPRDPFVLFGQMTVADATRSPAGTESAWAYTHLPSGIDHDAGTIEQQAERVEALIERHAPGFRASIVARRVESPGDLNAADANLVAGAIGGGTSSIHQQLFFRPTPGLGRSETPLDGLYLASSSAHPGGGVHGGPGAIAARGALTRFRPTGRVKRRLIDAAFARIYA